MSGSTTARLTLLPTGSTALERAVDAALPDWDATAALARPLDATLPEPFKPWLAAEWAIAEFRRYFADIDALIAAGRPWLLQRGSAASVLRALAWVGFQNARLDEDGATLHIDLGRLASLAELAAIAHVVRASVPAHVDFYRVYFAFDNRPVRLDASPALDAGILDNESGEWLDLPEGQDPLKVSFGRQLRSGVARPAAAPVRGLGRPCLRPPLASLDRGRLDASRLDQSIDIAARSILHTVLPLPVPRAAVASAPIAGASLPLILGSAPRAAGQPLGALASTLLDQTRRAIEQERSWDDSPWDDRHWGGLPFTTAITTTEP